MTPAETAILATYFFVLVILAVYGWHRYYLVYLYMKNKDRIPVPNGSLASLPAVTVQLPIYEEVRRENCCLGGGHAMWEPAMNTITDYIVAFRKFKETGPITPAFP